MKIAVTGATGFVGRALIPRLLRDGHEVRAWRHRTTMPHLDAVTWIDGRLNDDASTGQLITGCDAVVHAALSREQYSFTAEPEDPVESYQTNVVGSLKLIQSAVQHRVTRFIFVSSGAVHERTLESPILDETHPLWPASIYGAVKAAVETLVHAYGFSGKLQIATVRPVSIYGIADPIDSSKFYRLVSDCLNEETVDISGGGKMIHVDEVAQMIQLCLQTRESIAGQTYNGCDRFISHAEVATIVAQTTGRQLELIGKPKVNKTEMSTRKIERLGMVFDGTAQLERTIAALIEAIEASSPLSQSDQ